jgi:HK97 family phage prohead protease
MPHSRAQEVCPMIPQLTYKTADFELKDVDEKAGIISGYAAHYNNVDDGGDVIEPGAGAKTITERKNRISALYGHSFEKVVGHPTELREDDNGLYTVTKLAVARNGVPGGIWANEVYALAMNGTLKEMSIGYVAMGNATVYDPDTGVRRIGEYKLYEYSFVPLAMNPLARVDGVKALTADQLANIAHLLETEGKDLAVIAGNRAVMARINEAISAAIGATLPGDSKESTPQIGTSAEQRAAFLRRIELSRRGVPVPLGV